MEQQKENVVETNEKDYLAEIENLKANTVNREQYNKILEDNKRLIQTVARNNERAKAEEEAAKKVEKIDVDECRRKLFQDGGNLSNLEYVENALKLRKGIMDDGGIDPFLPIGNRISPTKEDVETANRVAEAFQSCIDYADGDSQLFTQELQRITNDIPMSSMINNKRRH